jgi:hypothetical protein
MYVFSKEITDATANKSKEMVRLFNLPDLWLGAELLRLAREARSVAPDLFGDRDGYGYNIGLLWDIIPEVAKRLSPILKIEANECLDVPIKALEGTEFRNYVGHFVGLSSMENLSHKAEYKEKGRSFSLLGNDMCNGNPVIMALDRISPATNSYDEVAARIKRISEIRGHDPIMDMWRPEFQTKNSISINFSDSPGMS